MRGIINHSDRDEIRGVGGGALSALFSLAGQPKERKEKLVVGHKSPLDRALFIKCLQIIQSSRKALTPSLVRLD